VPLPDGDFPMGDAVKLTNLLKFAHPFWEDRRPKRLFHGYGIVAATLLQNATSAAVLGQDFGAALTKREQRWLIRHKFARTAEDIVWLRSKLGLGLSAEQMSTLAP
jgi:glycerol-3-phosphate dehydrogenase